MSHMPAYLRNADIGDFSHCLLGTRQNTKYFTPIRERLDATLKGWLWCNRC